MPEMGQIESILNYFSSLLWGMGACEGDYIFIVGVLKRLQNHPTPSNRLGGPVGPIATPAGKPSRLVKPDSCAEIMSHNIN